MADHATSDEVLTSTRAKAALNSFSPFSTVRCIGQPLFRSQTARDYACLLDFDREVVAWSCLQLVLQAGAEFHVPDFLVHGASRSTLISIDEERAPAWAAEAAKSMGHDFETASMRLPDQTHRLRNARDLLRYGRYVCPLGDRVRLLAALNEHGTLSVSECLAVFRETRPMAGLSALVLHRYIDLDLDEAMIGPETRIARWREG